MNNKENIDTQASNLNNIRTKTKIIIKTGLGLLFFYGVWLILRGSSIYDGNPCGPYKPCFERVLADPFWVLFFLSSILFSVLLIISLYRTEKLILTKGYRIWKIVILSILLVGIATLTIFVPKSIYDSRVCDFGNNINCWVEKALKNNDISFCEIIRGYHDRDKCYLGVAQKGTDISICDKIHDDSLLGHIPAERMQCIATVAVNSKNHLLCNGAGDKSAFYINECYLRMSYNYNYKDLSVCENFIKTNFHDSICTGGKDSKCQKLERSEADRIKCVSNVSINNDDKNLCKKLDLQYQDFCENKLDAKMRSL